MALESESTSTSSASARNVDADDSATVTASESGLYLTPRKSSSATASASEVGLDVSPKVYWSSLEDTPKSKVSTSATQTAEEMGTPKKRLSSISSSRKRIRQTIIRKRLVFL